LLAIHTLATAFNIYTFVPVMQIEVLKSKIHRVRVTDANLNYVGSVSIDEDLMNAANLIENEAVHILNYNNGERFITYVIKAERGSRIICLNGPASHKVSVGDHIIILSYAQMDFEKAKTFSPTVVFPDPATNSLK
jgi:aspartate 1-decarboxylase